MSILDFRLEIGIVLSVLLAHECPHKPIYYQASLKSSHVFRAPSLDHEIPAMRGSEKCTPPPWIVVRIEPLFPSTLSSSKSLCQVIDFDTRLVTFRSHALQFSPNSTSSFKEISFDSSLTSEGKSYPMETIHAIEKRHHSLGGTASRNVAERQTVV